MPYVKLGRYKFDCNLCETRCDGKSKDEYIFDHDSNFSEAVEKEIINLINSTYKNLIAVKTFNKGYPDLEIKKKNASEETLLFIEVKVQQRAFMSIQKQLPLSGLIPSETVALNLSDLERYFEIKDKEQKPIFVVWCLMKRPCINGPNEAGRRYFSQEIDFLRKIRLKDKNSSRRFRRASGKGDVVNGEHKGVVVNYHFSLNELFEGLPELSLLDFED
ncbi:MAG: hypothetical protein WHV63_10725 [Ignavibacteria bacterium]|jgi:hypothetical protein|nr:hypothetical protein [Ignavibacteria bacterium]MDH7528245.1 hypothetical protein [Ignavibacteria bacterium]